MLLTELAKTGAFRERIRQNSFYQPMIAELRTLAAADEGLPADADYQLFTRYWRDGNRASYEAVYYRKRRDLNIYATLLWLYPENEGWRTRLENIIWLICNEFTWCLPPHLGGEGRRVEEYRTQIDLFAAETASALAEICHLLRGQLSALIADRVHDEIGRRIAVPFSENTYSWENSRYNWNAVCSGCVGTALLYEFPERFAAEKERLIGNMRRFLTGYADDGVCAESLGYWGYGFGYFVCFADLLRAYTMGETDLLGGEKVHQIALFQQKMYLNGGKRATFADTEVSVIHYYVGLTHYLCREYADARIPAGVGIPPYGSNDNCHHWMLHIRNFLWTDPCLSPHPVREEHFFRESGFYSCIDDDGRYGLFTKAGSNTHPHAHRDIGEVIFVRRGDVVIDDIGSGEYSAATFGADRYAALTHSSAGHSVPLIGGCVQWGDPAAVGRMLSAADGIVRIEMAPAYPPEACLSSLIREIRPGKSLYLTDSYRFTSTVSELRERFPTRLPVQIDREGRILLCGKEGTYELCYDRSLFVPTVETKYFTGIYGRQDHVNLIDLVCQCPPLSLSASFCIADCAEGTGA